MTDIQTTLFIKAILVIILLVMLWDCFGMVVELMKYLSDDNYSVQDILLIVTPLGGSLGGLVGYAFKILMKD